MKIYEAESLISAMEARSHEYKKMREQFVNLQRAFMGVADLGDDFQGKGADNIKAFFKEHARNIEEWLGMIDMQIAFLDSIAGTLEEAGLAGNTFVDTSYLENELETAYKKSNEIVAGQKQAMKTILEDIKDIIPLEVFSTFDFKQHISNAKVVKDNTVDKIHETDWKLKNEYEKSELNQDYIEERSKALLDATGKGKSAQPINFNAKAYYDTKVFKYRDEIHKKTEEYLTIKKEEAEKRRIEELKAKLATLKDNPDEYLKVAKEIGYDNLTSEQMEYVTAIEEAYEFRADPIKGTLEDGKHVLESMKGFVVGGYEFAKDTIQGTIETGKALIGHADNFVKNPKATVNSVLEYDYKATFESMLQSIADSWDEKMVHGDSFSRGHYIAYAIGTIWGLAEAGPTVVSGSKSLGKAGKAAAQTAKKSVNSVKQHFSPPKNRYTPALEGMLQRAGEAPNVKNTPLLKELLEDKKKSVLFKSIDKNGDFVGSLKGEQIHLKNVKVKEISYTKRDPAETKKLRSTFNGSVKKKFLKSLVNDPQKLKQLKNAGLSDSDIARMQDGLNPKGWQVHHKLPLDDGGTNSMDNLILMKNDPFHKAITNEQNALTRGLTPGQTKKIKNWPIPSGEIYPIEK
ncbi:T7SS effector LXG polymorphic toxin [Bacillus haynesii]|uniref:T7SS effector LXG polymorphic toxin n=3 Tax=Bacillus haynesii TaxID=1925021 RepID=UPI00227F9326|nr:T7SS effector LXG polymorphic toxin [Bacillus haynesii]MCY9369293.1 T7SS effector LXG polymorphic toxin [Bacillus haynesii]